MAVWALQGELDTGTGTVPAALPSSAGVEVPEGTGSPQHSLAPQFCALREGKVPNWAPLSAPITTFHLTAILKKPLLDSTTYSCPPWPSAKTKHSLPPP